MAMDRWEEVEAIFDEALDLSPDERADFLRRRCGQDRALLTQLEYLLANDLRAGNGFLEPTSSGSAVESVQAQDDQLIGQAVGSYRISQVIARGGMGTVYLAEQSNPRRRVALKLVAAAPWSPAARRRFEHESQILARLQHPNITQVFEAGTHELATGLTVPYFAMEYLPNARPITAYAEAHRLDLRQRLSLFLQVCDAVTHGHQRGIVHRDLKPDNILIDANGRPRVIDFGVARATDADIAATTMHTDAGQIIGTLQYMSPEQCQAEPNEIDTRTDVYSLGIVLFELVTGRVPYDVSHMTIHAAAHVICEQPPTSPGAFERRCRGDLETIILKAIEKQKDERYVSVESLALDLQRFLNHEPISARPPSAWATLVHWVARHPALTTLALCLVLGLSTLAATWLAVWYLYREPYQIARFQHGRQIDNDRLGGADEVRLLARNGNVIDNWTGESNSISDADLAEASDSRDGRKLALIAHSAMKEGALAGKLCAFDVDGDRHQPVWTKGIELRQLPSDVAAAGTAQLDFGVHSIDMFDIFPESDGTRREIVAIFSHSGSRRALRIYDLQGELLYQVWHRGPIAFVRWLPAARLLVCIGSVAAEHSAAHDARFHVIFALMPARELMSNDYVSIRSDDPALRPIWYRYFSPVQTEAFVYDVRFSEASPGSLEKASNVAVSIDISRAGGYAAAGPEHPRPSFQLTINAKGQIVPGSEIRTNEYTRIATTQPLPTFDLVSSPPEPASNTANPE